MKRIPGRLIMNKRTPLQIPSYLHLGVKMYAQRKNLTMWEATTRLVILGLRLEYPEIYNKVKEEIQRVTKD